MCQTWNTPKVQERNDQGWIIPLPRYICCSYGTEPRYTANPIMALLCMKSKGKECPKWPGNHIMELHEVCLEALDAPIPVRAYAGCIHSQPWPPAGTQAALETAAVLWSRSGPWQDEVLHWCKASSLSLTSSIVTE